MKLCKLYLQNFRGYEDITVKFDESFNVIIGKNDIGKSTILEALEIFFNNEKIKIEIDDCRKQSAQKEITIQISFIISKDKEYTIDTVPTNIEKEYLLDKDDFLTIKKTWDCSKEKISASSLKTSIIAYYPVDFDIPLISEKISDLKKRLEDYSEYLDVSKIKKNTSAAIRQAIYSVVKPSKFSEIEIPIDKEDSKKIFESIKFDLPLFFLFQADRENRDSDKEVQDPLKAITKTAISELKEELDKLEQQIKIKAEEIGNQTLEKLKEMNSEIANVLAPKLTTKAWDTLFSFSFNSDDGIPINKRGSGVRRLILLNYFRAEADRKIKSAQNVIYAIEEPETSQHPDWQIELFNALIELSNRENTQVITTTHSPSLAGLTNPKNILFLKKNNGKITIENGSDSNLDAICQTLGVLPDIIKTIDNDIKVIICVEGPTDVEFIENISLIFGFDLKKNKQVMTIPLGGGTLKYWVNCNYLRKLNKPEIHIYDNDVAEYKTIAEEINKRGNAKAFITKYYEIENYIHPDLIKEMYPITDDFIEKTPEWVEKWTTMDVPKHLSEFLKRKKEEGNSKIKNEGVSSIKDIFSTKGSKQMTLEKIKELHAYEELKSWFDEVKKYIK